MVIFQEEFACGMLWQKQKTDLDETLKCVPGFNTNKCICLWKISLTNWKIQLLSTTADVCTVNIFSATQRRRHQVLARSVDCLGFVSITRQPILWGTSFRPFTGGFSLEEFFSLRNR